MDDQLCLICFEPSEREWTCECCTQCCHWDCVGKWWERGRGCPHCREARLEASVEKYINKSVTKVEAFAIISIITTLLSTSGNHEKLSSILDID